jgi:hypothetical protein
MPIQSLLMRRMNGNDIQRLRINRSIVRNFAKNPELSRNVVVMGENLSLAGCSIPSNRAAVENFESLFG